MNRDAESQRLVAARDGTRAWKRWGPYLSERQWGTVREDASEGGDAWNHFTHDQSRSRAYRCGEDGLGGISDDKQVLCFALALWNGVDPILKERAFGLDNREGNHGEDVKEYYFYLDSTPTHSYMKYLYKYPQAAFPYLDLIATNAKRSRQEPEYELLDTGIFDEHRYFDVFVEYAKGDADDILIAITACNRGPESARLRLLPTLWFRNTWAEDFSAPKPVLQAIVTGHGSAVQATHPGFAARAMPESHYLYCDADVPLLFTENETNSARLFDLPNASPWVKDGINDYVVQGNPAAVNPAQRGTKASALYDLEIAAGASTTVRLRLTAQAPGVAPPPFADFDAVFTARRREADAFYEAITPIGVRLDVERSNVMRQALAGMLWSKQYYHCDLERHHTGHHAKQNSTWSHMYCDDIISMPDKWEYPWYAAWDLAFHAIPLAIVDLDFAKDQLDLLLRNDYLHPNGQLPACEWNFSDVNPPVHAWATMQLYLLERERRAGQGDLEFLKQSFEKLLVNFTWWINRKDRAGANIFEGGFLGLDNIGVFDRSSPLPTGGYIDQADGTAWMVFFSQQMLRIAVELALHEPRYQDFVEKFYQHTLRIAGAMDRVGEHQDEMWDETDGFFYDVLRLPNGSAMRLKVRSIVGLLPLAAVAVFEADLFDRLPRFREQSAAFARRHPRLIANLHLPDRPGVADRRMLSIVDETKLRRILSRMLDEQEFFSPHGIRALSRYHHEHPYTFAHEGTEHRVAYVPGDSDSGMFGGNSNWRGPVWMPINYLLYGALLRLYAYYGDEFMVECPTGSGHQMTLLEVAMELGDRLCSIFEPDAKGARPVNGRATLFRDDPYWRDLVQFSEYFHGDTGAGVGASHQTGWTGCIAQIIQTNGMLAKELLYTAGGMTAAIRILQTSARLPRP
ncbi:MGH1-like glycoside hydrolase domain-containing protein [Gemmatimonas sp.]|uniref:MGH1-like glycoside hydrolase domain-containing protein n=1 Tax=Gemmatimonas sp. TaxID=1962908 RepID=UPI003983CF62